MLDIIQAALATQIRDLLRAARDIRRLKAACVKPEMHAMHNFPNLGETKTSRLYVRTYAKSILLFQIIPTNASRIIVRSLLFGSIHAFLFRNSIIKAIGILFSLAVENVNVLYDMKSKRIIRCAVF